jgi:hypothetical protein
MRNKRALVALFALLSLVVGTVVSAAGPAAAARSHDTQSFLVTLYGFPDNSPPGAGIAFPQIHSQAGGTGTFDDPVTYATDQNELAPGTIVYYGFLHRYFIMEDDCVECDQDWEGQGPDGGPNFNHIDLWVGGEGGDANAVINCEDALTQQGDVTLNPSSDLPVDTTPLFDSSTNTCYDPSSFSG